MPLIPEFFTASSSGNVPVWNKSEAAKILFPAQAEAVSAPVFGTPLYSYYFDWLNQEDPPLAVCRLNEDCELELSRKFLKVKRKERLQLFPLRKIKTAKPAFRYLMLPMIIGGIVGPLAAVAVHKGQTDFWLGSALFLTGALLFIQGIRGAWQWSLFLDSININLPANRPNEAVHSFTDRLNEELHRFSH